MLGIMLINYLVIILNSTHQLWGGEWGIPYQIKTLTRPVELGHMKDKRERIKSYPFARAIKALQKYKHQP